MQVSKQKLITIITFWALTGLMVFSLPYKGNVAQESVTYKLELDNKVSLARSDNLENL